MTNSKSTMATLCVVLGIVFGLSAAQAAQPAQPELWKGAPDSSHLKFGVMSGLGIVDSAAGLALIGSISRKIVEAGFIPDINNSVSIEVQAGPLFTHDGTPVAYSTHLRWDFVKDTKWTIYSLGGVAGHVTGATMGNRFLLFPRFGVGTFINTDFGFAVRGEFSHELIVFGLSWSM